MNLLVATEDELSECVAMRLIEQHMTDTGGLQLIRKGGNGYLRSRLDNFISVAKRRPVLMLTDLDQIDCPPKLIGNWRGKKVLPKNLLLRVAVREIESWLLADREGMATFLRIASQKITTSPDEVPNSRRYLLGLARYAPREVRNELLPTRGAIASKGFGYNSCLRQFVTIFWSPTRAAERSQSLRRTINRLSELIAGNGLQGRRKE